MSLQPRITAPVFAVLLTWGAALPASAEPYRDAARHFTLEIPPGWQQMPAEEIQQINTVVRQRMPGSNIRYEAGFRPQGSDPGTFPYVLVQIQPAKMAGASYAEIEQSLSREANSAVKKVEGSIGDMAKNLSVGSGGLDQTRNRVLLRMQMDVTGAGRVQGFTIGHIGSEGIVYLHCYAAEKDVTALVPTYDQLSESFRFDPGYTFTPGARPAFGGKPVLGAVIGGIGGGFAALLFYLFSKFFKKKKPNPTETGAP